MQYGQALERLMMEVVISDPSLGPINVLKADVSDGFNRIGIHPTDTPKMGLVFPLEVEEKELVVIPLTSPPMGWKNLPPIFCMAMETVTDLSNAGLRCNTPDLPHSLDEILEAIIREEPPTPQPELSKLTRDPYLRWSNANPVAYVGVFAKYFLGIFQGPAHWRRRVRRRLFHPLDKVFWPCDYGDLDNCKEVLWSKNLRAGNCTWSTCQVLLGWVIDTVSMTLSFPPQRKNCSKEILAGIPTSQKRIVVDKWHRLLGGTRSIAIPLTGAQGLCIHMQEDLRHVEG